MDGIGWAQTRNKRSNPWHDPEAGPGGPEFGGLVEALQRAQEAVAAARPEPAAAVAATQALRRAAQLLEPFAVGEREQISGRRLDRADRGQALSPAFHAQEWDDWHVVGGLQLGRFHLGGNGAAHGGVIPLVFDDVLGRLANSGRRVARTAYLHVNYRAITPIGVPLRLEAHVERVEGRKRFLTGTLRHGATLTADAEGLFVELLPGQP